MTNQSPTKAAYNAERVASALQAKGYHVETKHYGQESSDVERWYVLVTVEGVIYETQFHERQIDGFPFPNNQKPGFNPAIAQVLDGIKDEALS